MADTTAVEQEESLWDQIRGAVDSARDTLGNFIAGGSEPAPDAPAEEAEAVLDDQPQQPVESVEIAYNLDENGSLIRPDADGAGMENNQRLALSEGLGGMAMLGSFMGQDVPDFARDGLGYSSGQIDMLDDLARRYDGIEMNGMQGTLVALSENDALRDNVMDALMENDQELAHYAAQAFEQDPALLAQFEDMVRTNPDALQDMLPGLQDNPASFADQVRNRGRDAETALAANQEVANQAQENTEGLMQELLSGDFRFADILGPQLGGWIDSLMGPVMGFMSGLMDKGTEFISQNLPEDSPVNDLLEGFGRDVARDVLDPTRPEEAPTGPSTRPENTNEVEPNRPDAPTPQTM